MNIFYLLGILAISMVQFCTAHKNQHETTTKTKYNVVTIWTKYTTLPDTVATTTRSVTTTQALTYTATTSLPKSTLTKTETKSSTLFSTSRTTVSQSTSVIQSVSLFAKYQETADVTLPTSTATLSMTLQGQAETTTYYKTVSTDPITTAPSMLFCYNFVE